MNWLAGWNYRQAITVAHSAGAGTGYQVEVNLTMAGLNNHAKSDFSDIRFTDSGGSTLLTHYLKSSVAGVSAVFLVKVTDDLSSVPASIYVYYGNASAVSTSTTAVYDFYDDTSTDGRANYVRRAVYGGNLTTLNWAAGSYWALVPANDNYMFEISGLNPNGNYEIKADYKWLINDGNHQFGIAARYSSSGLYYIRDIQVSSQAQKYLLINREPNPPSTTSITVGTSPLAHYKSSGVWYTFTGRVYGSSLFGTTSYEGETLLGTDTTYPSGSFGIIFYLITGNRIDFTNVVIRHYVSPEPTPSAYGTEEISFGPTADPATNIGTTSFQANWELQTNNDSYEIDVATDSAFTQFVSGYQALDVGDVLLKVVTGLSQNTVYYYRVRGVQGLSKTTNSNTITVLTLPGQTTLLTPLDGATNQPTDCPTTWNSLGSLNYRIQVATDSNFANLVFDSAGLPSALWTIGNLSPKTSYYWRVQGVNATGSGAWSTSRSFTTLTVVYSQTERMRDNIVTELQNITIANGYRTDLLAANIKTSLLDIDSVLSTPMVSVLLAPEDIVAEGTSRRVWNSNVEVFLIGVMNADRLEDFALDLKQVAAAICLKYANDATVKWKVPHAEPMLKVGRDYVFGKNKAFVTVSFMVNVFGQNKEFAA